MFREKISSYLKRNQKGDVFVIAAVSLAALMFCGAAVVDLGSLYSYKSQLQNAADAAALAGAHVYMDNEENVEHHPEADAVAESYVEKNLGTGYTANPTYQAKETENTIYYRVKLKDKAQTYFLKYFNIEPEISVDGIAAISFESVDAPFKDLFIFKKGFDAVNSIKNPDLNAIESGLSTVSNTFDGKIVFTDGSGNNADNKNGYNYSDLKYSSQTDNVPCFITEAGKSKSSVKDIAAAAMSAKTQSIGTGTNECVYGADGQPKNKDANNYWSRVDFENIDLMDFGNQVASMIKEDTPKTGRNQNLKTSSEIIATSDQIVHVESDVQNLTINVDSPGANSNPLILYCDPSITGMVKVELSCDMTRPLIVCVSGKAINWKGDVAGPNVQVNLNGHTFRGIIYAPNSVVEPFNAANSTFEGTIAADTISLRGDDATYRYVNFFGNSSSSGSGNKKNYSSSTIFLATPDNISWD